MSDENAAWENYYNKLRGRVPRQFLLDALEKFPMGESFHAIDLGCGDGIETAVLISRGWNVLAVDGESSAIQRLLDRVPRESRIRLQTRVAKFEEVTLPQTNLILASMSLPFCQPDYFPELWAKIVYAIKSDGRFAGQFFGIHDSWAIEPDMTFLTEGQVRAMLEKFEIEFFHERDEDGEATNGPKHWHEFTVIARKM